MGANSSGGRWSTGAIHSLEPTRAALNVGQTHVAIDDFGGAEIEDVGEQNSLRFGAGAAESPCTPATMIHGAPTAATQAHVR
jgi:hypothetical protein